MNLCNINEVKALLLRHGFRFSKSMGQNFLTADWVPAEIVSRSGLDKSHGVLEIGPGIGALTTVLSSVAGRVAAVELDRSLLPILGETLAECDNVELISGDILKLDISRLVSEKLAGYRPAVCANLPYNITTPVLSALIDTGLFESITVMVQREVARRICAGAGTPDYGAFTLYVNFYTDPEILFDVAPGCFTPQPKVYSSVVTLRLRSAPPAPIDDEALFFRIVKASFAQRRKTLINGLHALLGSSFSKEELSEIITACGFDEKVRGETLDIAGFARLSNAIGRAAISKQDGDL